MWKVLNNWRVKVVPAKSDGELLVAAKAGDSKSCSLLFTRYWRRVFVFLKKRVKNDAVAEEITQETFIAAFKYLHTYDGSKSSLYTWLCTIALRKMFKSNEDFSYEEVDDVNHITPEYLASTKTEVNRVVDIVSTLPINQQKAFYMKHLYGMCYNEIGDLLNCSKGYAKKMVYEAKKHVKEHYD